MNNTLYEYLDIALYYAAIGVFAATCAVGLVQGLLFWGVL